MLGRMAVELRGIIGPIDIVAGTSPCFREVIHGYLSVLCVVIVLFLGRTGI